MAIGIGKRFKIGAGVVSDEVLGANGGRAWVP
jgi:hypothetical protein